MVEKFKKNRPRKSLFLLHFCHSSAITFFSIFAGNFHDVQFEYPLFAKYQDQLLAIPNIQYRFHSILTRNNMDAANTKQGLA